MYDGRFQYWRTVLASRPVIVGRCLASGSSHQRDLREALEDWHICGEE